MLINNTILVIFINNIHKSIYKDTDKISIVLSKLFYINILILILYNTVEIKCILVFILIYIRRNKILNNIIHNKRNINIFPLIPKTSVIIFHNKLYYYYLL